MVAHSNGGRARRLWAAVDICLDIRSRTADLYSFLNSTAAGYIPLQGPWGVRDAVDP